METGAFICVVAIAVELLMFIATAAYIGVRATRGGTERPRRLWGAVGATALAGAVALAFSFVYSRDSMWYLVVAAIIVLPLILAAAVASMRRRQSS